MEKKKLSTQEILARARQQSGGAAGEPKADAPAPPAEPAPAADTAEAGIAPAPKAAPKPAAGGPKSTKDILAAARAQAAGGGASTPAGGAAPQSTADKLAAARAAAGKKPAVAAAAGDAPAAVAKVAAPAKPAGERPSVEEMLRAVREGQSGELIKKAGPAEIIIPPKPVKPAPVAKRAASEEPRRSALIAILISPFALAWTFFTLTSAVAGLAAARFMMPNVLVEPPSKFKVGPATDYPPGVVSTKWTSQFGVWIVHNVYKGKDLIYALSTVCTHLGCTPNWLEGEQKFKCPCHGSGFYITGVNFEGPAPRPLERHGIRIAEDGMIEVDKSVKFQEELGQWEDPASFVPVA